MGEHGVGAVRGGQDQPVHPACDQLLHDSDPPLSVGRGVRHQGRVAAARQRALDAAQDRGEDRVGEVGQEHAHEPRAAGAQARRQRIPPVAQPPRLLLHPGHDLGRDEVTCRSVEGAGRGRAVHARGIGHGLQGRRPHGLPPRQGHPSRSPSAMAQRGA